MPKRRVETVLTVTTYAALCTRTDSHGQRAMAYARELRAAVPTV